MAAQAEDLPRLSCMHAQGGGMDIHVCIAARLSDLTLRKRL